MSSDIWRHFGQNPYTRPVRSVVLDALDHLVFDQTDKYSDFILCLKFMLQYHQDNLATVMVNALENNQVEPSKICIDWIGERWYLLNWAVSKVISRNSKFI